ncbi:MAG: hypothetical protein U0939_04575 [Pirellulales bacterium]
MHGSLLEASQPPPARAGGLFQRPAAGTRNVNLGEAVIGRQGDGRMGLEKTNHD